jgi:hypothetical protein
MTALERRAASTGLKPTVLARNLVRVGLRTRHEDDLSPVIERVADALAEAQSAMDELRSLVD